MGPIRGGSEMVRVARADQRQPIAAHQAESVGHTAVGHHLPEPIAAASGNRPQSASLVIWGVASVLSMVAVAAILIDRGVPRSSVIREIQKRRKALCGERS